MRTELRDTEFSEYAASVRESLRQFAYVISGDWHLAEDLVQIALSKLTSPGPRSTEHPYLRQSGTSGVAYPSEVWRAIAPYLVPSSTADKITVWLQNHNSGSTTIDGLRVQINGPIAGVGLH